RYCSEFSSHRRIAVNVNTDGEEPPMSPETALALFRVGQECLMNIAKHSGVVSCDVMLNYTNNRATLEIEDQGNGFDLGELKEKTGVGIERMGERRRSGGGTLVIDSTPSRGTKVRAEAPITRAVPESRPAELDKTTEGQPNVSAA